jgi:hypothetical protein
MKRLKNIYENFFLFIRIPVRESVSNGHDDNGVTAQDLEAKEVNIAEYKDLARRVDSMESSVGFVLTKVEKDICIDFF